MGPVAKDRSIARRSGFHPVLSDQSATGSDRSRVAQQFDGRNARLVAAALTFGPGLGVVACAGALWLLSGVSLRDIALFVGYEAVFVLGPGWIVYGILRPRAACLRLGTGVRARDRCVRTHGVPRRSFAVRRISHRGGSAGTPATKRSTTTPDAPERARRSALDECTCRAGRCRTGSGVRCALPCPSAPGHRAARHVLPPHCLSHLDCRRGAPPLAPDGSGCVRPAVALPHVRRPAHG